jgi:hypothetical protein
MKFWIKGARLAVLLAPALALLTPAFAQVRPTTLSDATEPGSVIVFPKQLQGTVTLPEGGTAPATELAIGVVCPKGQTCTEHQAVKIRFHWVCGTTEAFAATSFVCQETDFDVTATVWEKIVLTPNGELAGAYGSGLPTKSVPAAHCPLGGEGGGYLIGWVVSPTNDQPIKFDGLIGDAVVRPGPGAEVGSGAEAGYDAIPIQADPNLASGAAIKTNADGGLNFDGGAGHYQAVTGQVAGDIRYTNLTTGPTFSLGMLTLLTLDVRSNRPNNPTFVDLDFFGGNPSTIGSENQLSTSTEFICWEEIPIATPGAAAGSAMKGINADLTTAMMGRKGVFVSAQAAKIAFTSDGVTGPVPLLGLAEVLEGGVFPPLAPWPRASFSRLFNSSVPVAAQFTPTPSPNFLP